MYTSTSTSIVRLLLLKTYVSTSTFIATSMCASTLTHPSILLELWLVAALGLGHGVAEPPVCDWGTAWPSLLPANASEAQGRSALLPLLWRDAFAHSLALLGGLRVLPRGLHASLQSSPARRALPPLVDNVARRSLAQRVRWTPDQLAVCAA